MSTIIIITPPPKKPPNVAEKGIPAVAEPTIADQLRDAADVLDGKEV